MQLEDWLDDLCVRFIINLPPEELVSVERICFQVEEAQWFYEDFIRPLDPSLPSLSLKAFSLRIFQHCPLFSTWSMHHYTTAFAEFLAYKQRVPVRGAIMLNNEMDEVVLVKGWKKGANWSFPRGKINKDENDLDCAIREVYEETGYDIQAAGLVKPEKDMKYIEVTMREQHMRLYVFRGVPKDTYFEPKTRKEISKIEWYKLTDLPTLRKKNPHHDGPDESGALNANKFYMVAPFLHPLKKWIAQQKKKENRYSSSHLALPPMMIEDSATEGEPGPTTHQMPVLSPPIPSSLPEVAFVQSQPFVHDPSSHLKELLKIGTTPTQTAPPPQPVHASQTDPTKSNALLSLLRNGPSAGMPRVSQTPSDHMSQGYEASKAPQQYPVGSGFEVHERRSFPSASMQDAQLPNQQRSLLDLFSNAGIGPQNRQNTLPLPTGNSDYTPQQVTQQPSAPYQQTGDPQFTRGSPEDSRAQLIPSANALPKLTHHTRALLDAFKPAPLSSITSDPPVAQASQQALAPGRQALLDAFKSTAPIAQQKPTVEKSVKPSVLPVEPKQVAVGQQTASGNASSLLSLFKGADKDVTKVSDVQPKSLQAPVELAAGPSVSPKPQDKRAQSDLLSAYLRKDAPKKPPQAIRAGETAATVEGPLNQPHFESIAKSPPQIAADNMRRSPVPAHRTLFDPKQPTPTKILQRVEESKKSHTKSPRQHKANIAVSSPKQKHRSRPEKAFQPQILKRPQTSDSHENAQPSPTFGTASEIIRKENSPLSIPISTSPVANDMPPASPVLSDEFSRRASHQTEVQKQNLLSLLTGPSGATSAVKSRQTTMSGAVSPLTQSQIVSPLGEDPPPISTRSRMSSLASITSAGLPPDSRPKIEKRQTNAGDKAFLLGYLGRIATQEGQSQ